MGNILELYLNGTLCKDCGKYLGRKPCKETRVCKECEAKYEEELPPLFGGFGQTITAKEYKARAKANK